MQKIIYLLIVNLLFFTTSFVTLADSYEEFETVPGFPDYACILFGNQFVIIDQTEETTRPLNIRRQQNNLNKELIKVRNQNRKVTVARTEILSSNPARRFLNSFLRIYQRYLNTTPELDSIRDRLQALIDLRTELNSRRVNIETNLSSIDKCTSRNSRACGFEVDLLGNLDSTSEALSGGAASIPIVSTAGTSPTSTTTYAELAEVANFSTTVNLDYSEDHTVTVTINFYKTAEGEWTVVAYINGQFVDSVNNPSNYNLPRELGRITLNFNNQGEMTTTNPAVLFFIPGSSSSSNMELGFNGFESKPSASVVDLLSEYTECL